MTSAASMAADLDGTSAGSRGQQWVEQRVGKKAAPLADHWAAVKAFQKADTKENQRAGQWVAWKACQRAASKAFQSAD